MSDRRLFSFVDATTTPRTEKTLSFDVPTGFYVDRGVHDVDVVLSAGIRKSTSRLTMMLTMKVQVTTEIYT